MSDLPYPLPYNLASRAEMLLDGIPDREDTVREIRSLLGLVYATGYADGRQIAHMQDHYDLRVWAVSHGCTS